jgi:hypothetical protein
VWDARAYRRGGGERQVSNAAQWRAAFDGRFTATSKAPFEQPYMRALFAHGERPGRDSAAFGGDPLGAPGGATVAER